VEDIKRKATGRRTTSSRDHKKEDGKNQKSMKKTRKTKRRAKRRKTMTSGGPLPCHFDLFLVFVLLSSNSPTGRGVARGGSPPPKVCLFIKSVREGAENGVEQFKVWFVTFLRFMCCGAHLFTNWFSTCQQYKRCEIDIIF